MIGKIVKGKHTFGLVSYLVGPGRANEHTNPQVVAGSEFAVEGWRRDAENPEWTLADRSSLTAYLDAHAFGSLSVEKMGGSARDFARGEDTVLVAEGADADEVFAASWERQEKERPHVVQIALTLNPGDRNVDALEWKKIAESYMQKMGWAGTRWAAINHGRNKAQADHIHIVMNAVLPDGTWVDMSNDWRRNHTAVREIEKEFALLPLMDSANERGLPGVSQAELRRRDARGARLTERERIANQVRAFATMSASEAEFVAMARRAGLKMFTRAGSEGGISGYSVMVDREAKSGKAIWCGGGKLAPDLSLPFLRERWPVTSYREQEEAWAKKPKPGIVRKPRLGVARDVAVQLSRVHEQWHAKPATDREHWQRAAADTSAILTTIDVVIEERVHLLEAARLVSRSAQPERYQALDFVKDAREMAAAASDGLPRVSGSQGRDMNPFSIAANVLRAGSKRDVDGWLAVLAQLDAMMRSIEDAHRVRGERIAAERIAKAYTDHLTHVTGGGQRITRVRPARDQQVAPVNQVLPHNSGRQM